MREWQWVTVAFAASSSWAIGLPTRIERPSTTARAPDSSTPASSSSRITPAGVHGTIASSRLCMRRPAFAVVSPSTSLAGSISPTNSVLVQVVGQRELEQDAVDAIVGVQAADQLGELIGRHVAARLVVERLDADLGRVLPLHAHVDRGGRVVADEDGGEPGLAVQALDLAPDLLAHLGGDRLAVDDLGAHGRREPIRRAAPARDPAGQANDGHSRKPGWPRLRFMPLRMGAKVDHTRVSQRRFSGA